MSIWYFFGFCRKVQSFGSDAESIKPDVRTRSKTAKDRMRLLSRQLQLYTNDITKQILFNGPPKECHQVCLKPNLLSFLRVRFGERPQRSGGPCGSMAETAAKRARGPKVLQRKALPASSYRDMIGP